MMIYDDKPLDNDLGGIYMYPILDKDDKAQSPSISRFCCASSWLRPPLAGPCANSKASPGGLTIIRLTASKYLGTVAQRNAEIRSCKGMQGLNGFDMFDQER